MAVAAVGVAVVAGVAVRGEEGGRGSRGVSPPLPVGLLCKAGSINKDQMSSTFGRSGGSCSLISAFTTIKVSTYLT